jgi:hypothetical protein
MKILKTAGGITVGLLLVAMGIGACFSVIGIPVGIHFVYHGLHLLGEVLTEGSESAATADGSAVAANASSG